MKNMLRKIGTVVIILFSLAGFSQGMHNVDIEFGSYGKEDNAVGINSSAINVKLPVRFYKGILINGFSYSQYDIDYDSNVLINTESIETFKTLSYSLNYIQRLNNGWSYMIMASPTISSDFESSLSMDDFVFNGGLIFTKNKDKSKFMFGLIYNTAMGFDAPMPFLNYSRRINNKFSYDLGFPITKIDYRINSNNKINLHIKPKGFYSNISNNLVLDNSEIAEKARYQSFVTGLNYLHAINNYWKISLDVGYQLSSEYNLLDGNKNNVYNVDTKNSVYMGVSLKLDLLKNRNKK